jgi:GT2 family glycosyltransferase
MNHVPSKLKIPTMPRELRHAGLPTLSVVVASCRSRSLLDACLGSLLPQCQEYSAAVIVARAADAAEIRALQTAYPEVRFVGAPGSSTIPELRAAGMQAADGDIVALTEDHCIASRDWVSQILRAHRPGVDVFGGAMDNAQRERTVDWAAYFAEYGFFAEGDGSTKVTPLITGANVTYSRNVLDDVIKCAMQGEWENVAHARLAAKGSAMQFLRTASVYQNQNYRFRDFCHDRFEHGLAYARRRLSEEGPSRRLLYLPGSLFLPLLLLFRIAQTIGREQRTPFLRALPLTFGFLVAWSLGEAVGYWRGPVSTEGEHV